MNLNSSKRKIELSSWLHKHQPNEFSVNLKLQKFLFFYETYSKIEGEVGEFEYLRAYPNGPVFSNVYGDYVYHKPYFIPTVQEMAADSLENVNDKRAKLSGFLVKVLNERELSDLTHELDAWKVHVDAINRQERNISIKEDDFSEDDFTLLKTLKDMYPIELIENTVVIAIMDKNFLISKEDFVRLTDEQKNVFLNLANEDLENPVYISLSEDGVMLVD